MLHLKLKVGELTVSAAGTDFIGLAYEIIGRQTPELFFINPPQINLQIVLNNSQKSI